MEEEEAKYHVLWMMKRGSAESALAKGTWESAVNEIVPRSV